jgi:hypothetical protein
MKGSSANSKRVLQALVRACAKAVNRNGEAFHKEFSHLDILSVVVIWRARSEPPNFHEGVHQRRPRRPSSPAIRSLTRPANQGRRCRHCRRDRRPGRRSVRGHLSRASVPPAFGPDCTAPANSGPVGRPHGAALKLKKTRRSRHSRPVAVSAGLRESSS